MIFDIVIPVGPNDAQVIETMTQYTRKNVIGFRNIYLVVSDPNIRIDGCIIVHENIFPFSTQSLLTALDTTNSSRVGWYLQQLIKLYAGLVIDGILNDYLVIDADTYFLQPTTFFDDDTDLPFYNVGTEYHLPYFEHMQKLHPLFTKILPFSGICHHMIFQTDRIRILFRMVEDAHSAPFHTTFMQNISKLHTFASGASEYELYFHFLTHFFTDKFIIRHLKWKNTHTLDIIDQSNHLDYVSYHWYLR
jgi:hypothetical protein